jgi:undecaprenyl-diphosphatase
VSFIQAIILGLIQGITEFFPISSSAHLKLAKLLMGIQEGESLILFDLVCHSGTLLSLILFLRKDLLDVLRSPQKIALYFLALVPLIPAYFLLKPVREIASNPAYLGYGLMITALLLFAASRKVESIESKKWQHVLCIGLMQTMALIPGISRSGSTISAARFCGWNWREAAQFSFLLAIPTILGGEALELIKGNSGSNLPFSCYAAAFIASFGLGLVGVRFIFSVYERGKVSPFAWYCLILGLLAWMGLHG